MTSQQQNNQQAAPAKKPAPKVGPLVYALIGKC